MMNKNNFEWITKKYGNFTVENSPFECDNPNDLFYYKNNDLIGIKRVNGKLEYVGNIKFEKFNIHREMFLNQKNLNRMFNLSHSGNDKRVIKLVNYIDENENLTMDENGDLIEYTYYCLRYTTDDLLK